MLELAPYQWEKISSIFQMTIDGNFWLASILVKAFGYEFIQGAVISMIVAGVFWLALLLIRKLRNVSF